MTPSHLSKKTGFYYRRPRPEDSPGWKTRKEQNLTGINTLPAELLLAVFELTAADLLQLDQVNQPGILKRAFSIPELHSIFTFHVRLSRVCVAWRNLLLANKQAWSYIHLGTRAFLHHKLQFKSNAILDRSYDNPLSIECVYQPPTSGVTNTKSNPQAMKAFFTSYICRLHSLRIVGPQVFVSAILEALVSKDSTSNPIPLSNLQIIMTHRMTGPLQLDLHRIAPGLRCFRVNGPLVVTSWGPLVEQAIVEGGAILPSRGHSAFTARNLILHDTPIVYMASAPINSSSCSSFTLSRVSSTVPGRYLGIETRRRIWIDLFRSYLCPTLETLRLASLEQGGVEALINLLIDGRDQFQRLRSLYIENTRITDVGVLAIMNAFPNLMELELVDMGRQCENHFLDIWKNGFEGREFWAALEMITVNSRVCSKLGAL